MKLHYIKLLRFTSFLVFAFMYTLAFGQDKCYCDWASGNDATGDGSSGFPYKTIQKCLDENTFYDGNDTLFVAGGTHEEDGIDVFLDRNFVIQGAGMDVTIIDGDGTVPIFDCSRTDSGGMTGNLQRGITFRDLTIKDGKGHGAAVDADNQTNFSFYNVKIENCDGASNGAAINLEDWGSGGRSIFDNVVWTGCNSSDGASCLYFDYGTLIMTNCSTSSSSGTGAKGAAFYFNSNDSVSITKTIISGNTHTGSGEDGGGIYFNQVGDYILLDSCTINNNITDGDGAGVYLYDNSDDPTILIDKCTFHNNNSDEEGGGFYISGEDATFKNCLFYENDADEYGGGFYNNSNINQTFINCTFADNTCTNNNGGGMASMGGTISVINCILYNNQNGDFHNWFFATYDVDYTVYEDRDNVGAASFDADCSTSDPLFVDPANDDYRIQTTSPAKNIGNDGPAEDDDLEGNDRITPFDAGCFEFGALACTDPTTEASALASSNVTGTSADITWTESSEGGIGTIIVIKEGSYPNDAIDNNTYSADANFGDGENIDASGSYVLYKGTDQTVSITGLLPLTTYYVEAWTYFTGTGCVIGTPDSLVFTTDSNYFYVDDNDLTGNIWTNFDADGTADDEVGCGTIDNPCRTIQYVLDNNTLTSTDVIRVDAGTYIENDITPDDDVNFSVIGADSSKTIFDPSGADSRAFILIDVGNLTLKDITIKDANVTSGADGGAAIQFEVSDVSNDTLTLINMHIYNCSAANEGAAVYLYTGSGSTSLNATGCNFNNNTASSDGGAIFSDGGAAAGFVLDKCLLHNNETSASSGGAMYIQDGNSAITNTLIYENSSSLNGNIYIAIGGSHTFNHCTVTDNTASGDGGITVTGGTVNIVNSIIYANTSSDIDRNGGTVNIDESIVGVDLGTINSATDTLQIDPQFVMASADNYHLLSASPAIDNADNTDVSVTQDLEGTTRTDPDMGAYEGSGAIICTPPNDAVSSLAVSSITDSSALISWTKGADADATLIVIREGSAPEDPIDGVTYAASTSFGSGTSLGDSSYVVFAGDPGPVVLTGLSAVLTYYIEAWSYSNTDKCYINSPESESFSTKKYLYVNNNNTTGDEWCTAAGDDITGDGSPSAPYATVAKALTAYSLDSNYEIRVDSGIYNNESSLLSGNTDDSYFTIRGVYRNGVPVSVFDFEGRDGRWMSITRGETDSLNIVNLEIKGYKPTGATTYGAFIYNSTSTGGDNANKGFVIDSCVIDDCDAVSNGGAIYWDPLASSPITIKNSTFKNCDVSSGSGGAISCEWAITIEKCIFTDNTCSANGNAIYLATNNVTHNIENSLFYSNGGSGVAAIYTGGNQMTLNIMNCTIMDNDGTTCGGVYQAHPSGGADVYITNSIVYGNQNTDIYRNGSTFNVTYSIYGVRGGSNFNSTTGSLPEGTNPLVKGNGDYHLQPTSPAIDTGLLAGAPTDDLDDSLRVDKPDLGCYEYYVNGGLLPIVLLSFNAHYEEEYEEVLIDWVTGSELNNDYFDIQRKKDGGKWSSIDRVEGAGNSNINLYYSAVDANPLGGISHYRLKQVDFDGSYNYSSVSSVTTGFMASVSSFNVYADEGGINIQLQDNKRSYYKLEIIAINGQIVHRQMLNSDEGLNVYQIAKNLGRGMYQVVLSNQSEIYSKKLVLQY